MSKDCFLSRFTGL